MKNVIAKTNKADATSLFVDGKRVSKATLDNQLADELRAHIAAQGVTLTQDDAHRYVVELHAHHRVDSVNRWRTVYIEAKITATVDTFIDGLRLMACTRTFAEESWAHIFDKQDYKSGKEYRWYDAKPLSFNGESLYTSSAKWALILDCLALEISDKSPAISEYDAAVAELKAAENALETAKKRVSEAYGKQSTALLNRNKAVAEHLQSFIA